MSKNRLKNERKTQTVKGIIPQKDIYDILINGIMSTEQLWGVDSKIPKTDLSTLDKGKIDTTTIAKKVKEASKALRNGNEIKKQGIELIIQSNDRLNKIYNLTPTLAYLRAIEIISRIVWDNPSYATFIITLIEGSKRDDTPHTTNSIIASNPYLSGLYKESPDKAYATLFEMIAEEVEGDPKRAAHYVSLYGWSIHKLDPDGFPIMEQELPSKKRD